MKKYYITWEDSDLLVIGTIEEVNPKREAFFLYSIEVDGMIVPRNVLTSLGIDVERMEELAYEAHGDYEYNEE